MTLYYDLKSLPKKHWVSGQVHTQIHVCPFLRDVPNEHDKEHLGGDNRARTKPYA